MKRGLFGGTFDPVHFGHLRAAEELAAILQLDCVIFIPSALPPHKTSRVILPFEHRARMIQLAIEGDHHFSFSDVENRREGKSFSIETVRYFLNEQPDGSELCFITGLDAFDAITTWRDWETLLTLCDFGVMTRPGYENRGLHSILPEDVARSYVYDQKTDSFIQASGRRISFRKTTFMEIASSDIRRFVQTGESIRYLTPDPVIQYIEEQNLYR
jgi:nicotinate-nucleotide adenylyltransferase